MKPLKIWAYLDNFFFIVSKGGPKEKCWKPQKVSHCRHPYLKILFPFVVRLPFISLSSYEQPIWILPSYSYYGVKRLEFFFISLNIVRGYVYSLCQIFQKLCLFKGLFRTLEYEFVQYIGSSFGICLAVIWQTSKFRCYFRKSNLILWADLARPHHPLYQLFAYE